MIIVHKDSPFCVYPRVHAMYKYSHAVASIAAAAATAGAAAVASRGYFFFYAQPSVRIPMKSSR